MELSGEGTIGTSESTSKLDKDIDEDSDSMPLENIKVQSASVKVEVKPVVNNESVPGNYYNYVEKIK